MKKRIFGWICTLLAVAMLCSSFALADTQPDAIGSIISGMSLRDKLAQMMLFSIRTWKEDGGAAPMLSKEHRRKRGRGGKGTEERREGQPAESETPNDSED